MTHRAATVMLIVVGLSACAVRPAGPPLRTVEPGPVGVDVLCTPAALGPFRVKINPIAEEPTWGEWLTTGEQFRIAWPAGFSIVTSPALAIADPTGSIVVTNGGILRDAVGNTGDPVVVCGLNDKFYDLTGQ